MTTTDPLETRLREMAMALAMAHHQESSNTCSEAADAIAACREAMKRALGNLESEGLDTDYLTTALTLLGPAPEEKR